MDEKARCDKFRRGMPITSNVCSVVIIIMKSLLYKDLPAYTSILKTCLLCMYFLGFQKFVSLFPFLLTIYRSAHFTMTHVGLHPAHLVLTVNPTKRDLPTDMLYATQTPRVGDRFKRKGRNRPIHED